MTKKTKRITVSLSREQSDFLEMASEALDKTQSALMRDMVQESMPMLTSVIKHLKAARESKIDKSKLLGRILKETIKSANSAQNDLIDSFEDEK